jgi:iron complex outermembrane receptor protein
MDLIDDKTLLGNITWQYSPSGAVLTNLEANLWGSYVDHFMSNELRDLQPRMANNGTEAETINYGGRTETELRIADGRMFTGADFRVEQAEGVRSREMLMGPMAGRTLLDNAWQKSRVHQAGMYSEFQKSIGNLRYVVAARLDFNRAEMLDPDEQFLVRNGNRSDVSQVNPSASAGLVYEWTSRLETGIWVGRASRSGSITERFINQFPVGLDPYEMLGNPALDPEVNNQVDLVTNWNTPSARLGVNLYYSLVTGYISSEIDAGLQPRIATSPGVRRYVNIGEAQIAGVEVSGSQLLGQYINHGVQLAWTYGKNLETGEALPEIAPMDLRYHIGASLFGGRLQPDVSLRYVSAQNRVAASFGELSSKSFTRVDISLTSRITEAFRISAGIQNLLDAAYYEHLSRNISGVGQPIYEPGRNIWVTVGYSF